MKKLKIPYCEFYITNVCNMSCTGCNRFNNFHFTGFQKWEDYKDIYAQWSREIEFNSTAILGGEPFLNPSFMSWARGITDLWPKATVRIISNGTRLHKVFGLYELLVERKKLKLCVGIHNKKHKKEIVQRVKDFLQAPFAIEFSDENPYQSYMTVTDANGVEVKIEYNWWFHQGSIIKDQNTLTLHNSDPVKAHNNCHMKTCHHFVSGKLYKCGVVAVLPDFDQQNKLQLSQQDRDLMLNYAPLELTADYDTKLNFVNNLTNPINQCKFCPEAYNGQQIYAEEKKNL